MFYLGKKFIQKATRREHVKNISLKTKQIITICAGHFTNDVLVNLLVPISFLFKESMNLTYAQQAMIGTVIIALGSFAQPLFGHYVDKKAKPGLLIFSIIWIGVFMSITGFINNYYLLLVVAGLGAMASSLYHPLGSTIVVKLLGKTKGAGLSVFITVGSFAIGFSPFIALPLTARFGLKATAFFIILAIITAFMMWVFKIQQIEMDVSKKENKNEKAFIGREKIGWITSLVSISVLRTLIVRSFLLAFGVQILTNKGISVGVIAIAVPAMMWVGAAGTFLGGYLNDKYNNKFSLIICNILTMIFLIGLIIFDGYLAVVLYCGLGFSSAIGNTPNITMVQEMIPKNTSLGMGLVFGFGGALAGVGMYFYGIIADMTGLNMALILLMIPAVIMNILIFITPRYENGEKLHGQRVINHKV